MNPITILRETIEGYLSGGASEAVSEGIEETAEEATGKEL